jgi:hypothetical protein
MGQTNLAAEKNYVSNVMNYAEAIMGMRKLLSSLLDDYKVMNSSVMSFAGSRNRAHRVRRAKIGGNLILHLFSLRHVMRFNFLLNVKRGSTIQDQTWKFIQIDVINRSLTSERKNIRNHKTRSFTTKYKLASFTR